MVVANRQVALWREGRDQEERAEIKCRDNAQSPEQHECARTAPTKGPDQSNDQYAGAREEQDNEQEIEERHYCCLADDERYFKVVLARQSISIDLFDMGAARDRDLTARFDISQPAVSQHLATLKDAGLVNARRDGRFVYYRVEPCGMTPLIDWIAHYRAFWTEHVDRLERLLKTLE